MPSRARRLGRTLRGLKSTTACLRSAPAQDPLRRPGRRSAHIPPAPAGSPRSAKPRRVAAKRHRRNQLRREPRSAWRFRPADSRIRIQEHELTSGHRREGAAEKGPAGSGERTARSTVGPGLGEAERRQPGGPQPRPVEPNPPAPLAVGPSSSASSTTTRATGATTSWATRSPRRSRYASRPRLTSATLSSPR